MPTGISRPLPIRRPGGRRAKAADAAGEDGCAARQSAPTHARRRNRCDGVVPPPLRRRAARGARTGSRRAARCGQAVVRHAPAVVRCRAAVRHAGRGSGMAVRHALPPTAASRSPSISVDGAARYVPQGTDGADAVGLCPRRADHGDADAGRGPRAAAVGRNGFRSGRRHARPVLRHSGGQAQRPARPAAIVARQEGESARVDDDRAGRDAVRLHLRDQGPARRHQGAARAPADPGAQGGDARRRVLREKESSVAAARERAGRSRVEAGRR